MAIRVQCSCGHEFTVPDSRDGQRVPCDVCGLGVIVKRRKKKRKAPSPGKSLGIWLAVAVGAGVLVVVLVGAIAIGMALSDRPGPAGEALAAQGADAAAKKDPLPVIADTPKADGPQAEIAPPKVDSEVPPAPAPKQEKPAPPPPEAQPARVPAPAVLREHSYTGKLMCFSADGQFFLSYHTNPWHEIKYCKTGEAKPAYIVRIARPVMPIHIPGLPPQRGTLGAAAITPDGRRFLAGYGDGTARIFLSQPGQQAPAKLLHEKWRLVVAEDIGGAGIAKVSMVREIDPDEPGKQFFGARESVETAYKRLDGVAEDVGALSSDGKFALLGGARLPLSWWSLDPVRALHVMDGLPTVVCADLSPDNTCAVSGHADGRLVLWSLAERKKRHDLTDAAVSKDVKHALFTPDGRCIVSLDERARVWDSTTGKLLRSLEGVQRPEQLAIAHDGRHALVSARNGVTVYALDDGRRVGAFNENGPVVGLAFARSGDRALIASTNPQGTGFVVREHPLPLPPTKPLAPPAVVPPAFPAGPTLVHRLHAKGRIDSLALSPGEKLLAAGHPDGSVTLWDPATGKEQRRLQDPQSRNAKQVAFSADGKQVFACDSKNVIGWDLATGKRAALFSPPPVSGNSFLCPDGRHIVLSQFDNLANLIDVVTGRVVRRLQAKVAPDNDHLPDRFVFVSPDMKRALSHYFPKMKAESRLRLWDLTTGKELARYDARFPLRGASFLPKGQRILSPTDNAAFAQWNVQTGQELSIFKTQTNITAVAVSRDGKWALAAEQRGCLSCWDLETSTQFATLLGPTRPARFVVLTRDGRRAISGEESNVFIWDMPLME